MASYENLRTKTTTKHKLFGPSVRPKITLIFVRIFYDAINDVYVEKINKK